MYIYHPITKMTHKNDGFIENLMKVPAPLNEIIICAMHLRPVTTTIRTFN